MIRKYASNNGFFETEKEQEACWVSAETPTEKDTDYLTGHEGIPRMFLEYLSDLDERPRFERDGEWTMTIIRIPIQCHGGGHNVLRTVPLGVISRDNGRVYTVCYHTNRLTSDFADHTRRKGICYDTVADFTLRILYSAAFWYLDYLRTLADLVVGTEKVLTGDVENDNLIHLLAVQKSLVYFNTAVKGDRMLLERIPKIYGKDVDMDLYEDVEIELNQADTTVGIYSDILESTMGTYSSIISNNMSAVMKRMTGLTIILMVPTFVASLYGMNVDILLTGPYAFWIVIGIAIVLTFLAFMLLRKMKWV